MTMIHGDRNLSSIRFKIVERIYENELPALEQNEACISYDNWNDYGYETSYHLYFRPLQKRVVYIGYLKILHASELITHEQMKLDFESLFDVLSGDYVSLGQRFEYYENIKELGDDGEKLLNALRDVTALEKLPDKFEDNEGIVKSLRRFSEANAIYNSWLNNRADGIHKKSEYEDIVHGASIEEIEKFSYQHTLSDGKSISVTFDFSRDDFDFHRVQVIIGKNGTGKTRYLSKLAKSIAGGDEENEIQSRSFLPSRPAFTKIIVISYGLYDKFEVLEGNKRTSYKYCGFTEGDRVIPREEIERSYTNSVIEIFSKGRKELFHISLIPFFTDIKLDYFPAFSTISSGQKIIAHAFASILADIEDNSLLIFDEPESHLHPNAINSFVRALSVILREFNSYAIIATHSPKIVQEVPSKYVTVFRSYAGVTKSYKLSTESFGDDLDRIDLEVFEASPEELNYRKKLEAMLSIADVETIERYFEGKLNTNAFSYLLSIEDRE